MCPWIRQCIISRIRKEIRYPVWVGEGVTSDVDTVAIQGCVINSENVLHLEYVAASLLTCRKKETLCKQDLFIKIQEITSTFSNNHTK